MLSRITLIGSGVFGILLSYIFYIELPDTVAIHFGEDGLPDSWATKANNFLIMSGFHIAFVSIFLGIPSIINKLPTELVNLPNREYWLAPARREGTLIAMENRFNVFGTFLNVFFIILGTLNFQANMNDPVSIHENAIVTAGLFVVIFVVLWIRAFFKRFKRSDDEGKKES